MELLQTHDIFTFLYPFNRNLRQFYWVLLPNLTVCYAKIFFASPTSSISSCISVQHNETFSDYPHSHINITILFTSELYHLDHAAHENAPKTNAYEHGQDILNV